MQGFPFDSQLTFDSDNLPVYDRAVSSQPLRKLIRDLFTTGVMPNPSTNLQVSSGTDGMTVQVQAGFAVVDGGLCQETETRTLEVTAADTTYDRIDTVVLRWNENVDARTADLYVVAGTPSATPVRPALQRDNSIYEIGLADIFITKRVATITDDKITDTRYESERCGIVSSVSEWDTTTIYQQIQADLAGFKANEEASFDSWSTNQMNEFVEWVATIKDILDAETAGHLQLEIEALQNQLGVFYDSVAEAEADLANIPDGTMIYTPDPTPDIQDEIDRLTSVHFIDSQVGSGSKNVTIYTASTKRLLVVTKKSGKVVGTKEIPTNVLESGDVIVLGNTSPVIGTDNVRDTQNLLNGLVGKELMARQENASSSQYLTSVETYTGTLVGQIGLASSAELSDGATLTFNGNNSFTLAVTDSTLSVYLYADMVVLGGSASAMNVAIDLTDTDMVSTNVEDAIKELYRFSGKVRYKYNSKSIANNSDTDLAVISDVQPGVYIVLGSVRCDWMATNTSFSCTGSIILSNTSGNTLLSFTDRGGTGGYGGVTPNAIVIITNPSDIKLRFVHNIGSTQTCQGRIAIVKISDVGEVLE